MIATTPPLRGCSPHAAPLGSLLHGPVTSKLSITISSRSLNRSAATSPSLRTGEARNVRLRFEPGKSLKTRDSASQLTQEIPPQSDRAES